MATDYLQASTGLLEKADAQGRALGPQPPPPRTALDAIDAELDATLERGFHRAQQERERLIQGGDEFFRKIVAVGRDFLDPGWNGLPAIEHPLDHDIPVWSEPPAMQPLPDPSGLLQPPVAAPVGTTVTGVAVA
ncbi:MAG: hypothetical protein GAK31_00542 [Stenotrophomonas maltophilia]|uniref:Uncharacterized protein n=1 Tax=Stenotrophomonas maltophilia TaxID=40324 RepID=A0A7V8FJK2_STEMA|nr:MAG: hypothetical protein GAK31_00542 [Stenotrophomonas maltophilia]